MRGGDGLEDDFVVDHDLIAQSDEEIYDGFSLSDNALSETSAGTGSPDPAPVDPGQDDKKRKRRAKERERKAKKRKLAESGESAVVSIADQSPSDLSNYLASLQARSASKFSALELEDILIPEISIVDTQAWTGSRTLDNLVEFIAKVLPTLHVQLGKRPKNNGSPTLLFITGAALRVADVTRALKNKKLGGKENGEVAKLFAKHIKLAEHVTYLKRTKIGIAVGTPGRVGKLLGDTDALSVSSLSHIILDVTHRDPKNRNILDIPETRDEVLQSVLAAPKVLQGIKGGKIRVVFF
ncbi:hypothetical protein AX15_003120 [Amanita polypyramis BW_CC]|nr:hypothetical protein AX15_003120 [Amanita polypyramis BW_CC]